MKKQGFLKKGIAFFATLTMALSMMFTAPVHATTDDEILIQKVWHDGDGRLRPASVEVIVETEEIATGIKSEHNLILSAEENWVRKLPTLPGYKYKVIENAIPNYHMQVIKHDDYNYTIVNTSLMTLNLAKTWVGDEDHLEARPDQIAITVFQNGKEYHKAILKAPDWQYAMEVPEYDENNEDYDYSIEEEPVPNYTSELFGEGLPNGEGMTIIGIGFINTYTPEDSNKPEDPIKPEEPKKEEPETGKKTTTKTMPKTAAGVSLAAIIGLAGSAAYMARKRR